MSSTGNTAAQTVSIIGRLVADPLAEVDLAIDPQGDLLLIDPGGDVLMVSPAVTWTGTTASEAV